jgi:RNA polymerase sigma-70 factor (ECF subfamily)
MDDALPRITLGRAALDYAAQHAERSEMSESHVPEPVSDEQLMAGFSRGSHEAFGELFLRYKQKIFGFFRRRVTNPALAEELTQDCFLAVLRGASRYEPGALFRTYLYAIALKMALAHRRKMVFRGMFFGVAQTEPAEASHLDAEITLRQAMGRLDRVDREVLMLREYEELSYAEIAALLRIPVNTVRSRLFRARMALREILAARAVGTVSAELTKAEGRL